MNRALLAIALGVVVGLQTGPAGAEDQPWWAKAAKGAEAKPLPADQNKGQAGAAAVNPAQRDAIERAKAMQEWQAKLSGSKWEIEVVVSRPGQPKVVEADVLTFEQGSVGSDVLGKAGYDRASYSLYPPEGQSISWEAMQRKAVKDGEESAIWRGEITGEIMQGFLLRRRPGKDGAEGAADQFSFTGKKMAPAPEPPADPVGQIDPVNPGVPVDALEPGAPQQP